MLDPKLVSELREALRLLGVSEAEIDGLNLESASPDVARGVVAGLSIPQSQKAGVGFAALVDGVAAGGPRSLTEVFRLAAATAEVGGSHILAGLVIAIATAAAAVLPMEDERTPADFVRMIADRFEEPSAVAFEQVKAEWHSVRAEQDIRSDLDRMSDGDFDIGDILGDA